MHVSYNVLCNNVLLVFVCYCFCLFASILFKTFLSAFLNEIHGPVSERVYGKHGLSMSDSRNYQDSRELLSAPCMPASVLTSPFASFPSSSSGVTFVLTHTHVCFLFLLFSGKQWGLVVLGTSWASMRPGGAGYVVGIDEAWWHWVCPGDLWNLMVLGQSWESMRPDGIG